MSKKKKFHEQFRDLSHMRLYVDKRLHTIAAELERLEFDLEPAMKIVKHEPGEDTMETIRQLRAAVNSLVCAMCEIHRWIPSEKI